MQDSKQIKNKKQNSESAYDFITEFDQYLFGQGTHYDLYNKLGAHPMPLEGQPGVFFAVWAPNAQKVSVVGDFNKWDRKAHLMKRTEPMGIYELFIPDLGEGEIYKYCVTTKQGNDVLKTDPYAFQMEKRPNNASVVTDISDFKGAIRNGWNTGESLMCGKIRCLSMRCIRVPGRNIRSPMKMRTVSITTESWQWSWRNM